MRRHDFKHCPRCAHPLVERPLAPPRLACPADGCDFIFYDNPTPVVAALVEHQGEVVLVRNVGWPESWFGLMSGFLERGESPEDAALRELHEELGLHGQIASLIGVYSFEMMNQVIIAYHIHAHGDLTLSDEIAAVKRVAPDKLRPWPMGTGQAVRDWLASSPCRS